MRDEIQYGGQANINSQQLSSLLDNNDNNNEKGLGSSYGTDPSIMSINHKKQETLIEIRDLLVDVKEELRKADI